jgi:uncharacterized protein (TIGR02147 family)
MSLFSFKDYREFLLSRMAELPKKGHGELSRMAQALGVHSALLSMVLSGQRDLSLDQSYELATYLGFTELETEYFTLLVSRDRSGNHRYKAFIEKKLEKIRQEAQQVVKRFPHERTLTNQERAVFYSSWLYSAIRIYTSTTEEGRTVEEIVERFHIARPFVIRVLDFLAASGLVVKAGDRFKLGTQRTFIEHGSPHLLKHHSNWRIKALEQADRISESELMFTSPFSVSKDDFQKIREQVTELLKQFSQVVKDSPAEEIACLNIDLFWIQS